tara:strand:+ start:137 stop:472 length:336 start_codon:yes stop_codon:yes gene_type:complete
LLHLKVDGVLTDMSLVLTRAPPPHVSFFTTPIAPLPFAHHCVYVPCHRFVIFATKWRLPTDFWLGFHRMRIGLNCEMMKRATRAIGMVWSILENTRSVYDASSPPARIVLP